MPRPWTRGSYFPLEVCGCGHHMAVEVPCGRVSENCLLTRSGPLRGPRTPSLALVSESPSLQREAARAHRLESPKLTSSFKFSDSGDAGPWNCQAFIGCQVPAQATRLSPPSPAELRVVHAARPAKARDPRSANCGRVITGWNVNSSRRLVMVRRVSTVSGDGSPP